MSGEGDLASDLLRGAKKIAQHVYENCDKPHQRKVYHKHETGQWPIWKDGSELLSRKSLLNKHFNPPVKAEAAE